MGRLTRRRDWQARLIDYLTAARARRFEPGRHDCALFAAGALEAISGEDPAASFRGRYKTETGGLRVLKRETGGGLEDRLATLLNPVSRPAPGDIAVIDRVTLGVVQGQSIYVLRPEGLALIAMSEGRRFYRV